MRNKLTELLKHPLISGSTIVFIGALLMNILSYIFNLLMGRFLSVTDYGLLITLMSLFSLFGILPTALSVIFARFAAEYHTANDTKNFTALLTGGFKILTIISGVLFILLLVLIPFFSSFLHVSDVRLLVLIYVLIITSVYSSLTTGVLQGQLRFYLLSFFNILNPLTKIILGAIFIFLGWKILGLITAVVLAGALPLIGLCMYLKRKHVSSRNKDDESALLQRLRTYGTRFFLSSVGITLFTSLDILFVRHFFNPTISGQYAALSLMGKAIFYLTSPIYFVFFPLIVQKRKKKESLTGTLVIAVLIVSLISACLSLIYFIYPTFVVHIFFPKPEYRILSHYLGYYSVYIFIFSVASLFSNYFLSIGKTEIYKINLGCGILFIVLLGLFHTSLMSVITVLFVVALVLLCLLLLYFRYYERD